MIISPLAILPLLCNHVIYILCIIFNMYRNNNAEYNCQTNITMRTMIKLHKMAASTGMRSLCVHESQENAFVLYYILAQSPRFLCAMEFWRYCPYLSCVSGSSWTIKDAQNIFELYVNIYFTAVFILTQEWLWGSKAHCHIFLRVIYANWNGILSQKSWTKK